MIINDKQTKQSGESKVENGKFVIANGVKQSSVHCLSRLLQPCGLRNDDNFRLYRLFRNDEKRMKLNDK
jgi:hypothetical protein